MEGKRKYSYITVLSNKRYIPGVIALKRALDSVKSRFPLTILVPDDQVEEFSAVATKLNCKLVSRPNILVDHKQLPKEHYWSKTFFKLAAVSLVEFDKIILLDSDMLVAKNIDHLFEYPHMSATTDGQGLRPTQNNLNSGLMVIEPSVKTFKDLVSYIDKTIFYRGTQGLPTGDQDVFRAYMPEWVEREELHLSEVYNTFFMDLQVLFTRKIYKRRDEIYVVHFIGKQKPWEYNFKKKLEIFRKSLRHFNLAPVYYLYKYLRLMR